MLSIVRRHSLSSRVLAVRTLGKGASRTTPAQASTPQKSRAHDTSAQGENGGGMPRPSASFKTAREAVEGGDARFSKREFAAAIAAYRSAMQLRPNDDEARAAQYNEGCAHLKLEQWPEAMQCFREAVNRYRLKVNVLYKVRATLCKAAAANRRAYAMHGICTCIAFLHTAAL